MIIRQTVLTLIVIFVLYFCHICHQDTRSVQKRHFMCIAYPWSPVSIFNISESSLAEVPTGRSFSHFYRPKTIQPPILKYNIVPFSIFTEEEDTRINFREIFHGGRITKNCKHLFISRVYLTKPWNGAKMRKRQCVPKNLQHFFRNRGRGIETLSMIHL